MADASQTTTYEEAKQCPRCHAVGEVRKQEAARFPGVKPGTMLQHVYCVTQICPWFETSWIIQVNPDGTIPPPKDHRGEKKVYQGFELHDQQAKELMDALERQRLAQQNPGTEIRNPNG